MKAYHLFLIRHGITQGNEDGRYIGSTDQPLSARGVDELHRLAASYAYPKADAFFSSPLKRCVQTMGILYPHAEPSWVDGLRECDFGAFENKTMDELKGDPVYQKWVAANGMVTPPRGENIDDFRKRCCGAFAGIVDKLLREGTTRAVICAHGGTIMFILSAFGYPNRPFYKWMMGNGRGYEIVVTPQLWMSAKAFEIVGGIPEEAPTEDYGELEKIVDELEKEPPSSKE